MPAYLSKITANAAIDLVKSELQNAKVQNLASAPGSPVTGQIYYNSTGGDNHMYYWNGSAWIVMDGSQATVTYATPGNSAVGDSAAQGSASTVARSDHVHGRESFGAVTAISTFGASSANGSATTVARSDHNHGSPVHDNAAHSAINLSALAAPTGAVAWGSQRITTLADPTSAQDAATKNYVDSVATGLDVRDAARLATAAVLPNSPTYSNGTSGVGATLTAGANAALTVDGTAVALNDRILVKNQASGLQNGIYTVTTVGSGAAAWVLTRAADDDTAGEISAGSFVFVQEGSANSDTGWVQTTNNPITVGTTALVFTQFSGAGAVDVGTGLSRSGTIISLSVPVSVANGGTGASTFTTNGVLLGNTTSAITATTAGSAYQVLRVPSGGGAPAFGSIDLSQSAAVTGTLAVANGGTGGNSTATAKTALGFMTRYAIDVGGSTSVTVTHNLGTKDVLVNLWDNTTPFAEVIADVQHTTTNTVTLLFQTAPSAAQYRCVVLG